MISPHFVLKMERDHRTLWALLICLTFLFLTNLPKEGFTHKKIILSTVPFLFHPSVEMSIRKTHGNLDFHPLSTLNVDQDVCFLGSSLHFMSWRVCGQLDQQYCLVLTGMKLQHEDTADLPWVMQMSFSEPVNPGFPLPPVKIFLEMRSVFSADVCPLYFMLGILSPYSFHWLQL